MVRPPLFDTQQTASPRSTAAGLAGSDILSVSQFSEAQIDYIFDVAKEMRDMHQRVGGTDLLRGMVLACLFYEPSTRTSSSFIAAMERLGGFDDPDHTGCAVFVGVQGRNAARHDQDARTIFRRDRATSSRNRLGGHRGERCQYSGD